MDVILLPSKYCRGVKLSSQFNLTLVQICQIFKYFKGGLVFSSHNRYLSVPRWQGIPLNDVKIIYKIHINLSFIVSNYFVIWYFALCTAPAGSILHKLSGPAHKAGYLATDWLLKVLEMLYQSEVGCCNINTPSKAALGSECRDSRSQWKEPKTTLSPRQSYNTLPQ